MYIYFTPHSFLHSLEGHLIWNRYWDEVFELSQIRSIKFIFLMTDATTSLIFFFALASTFSSVSGAKHSMNFENTWGSQFVKWILSENLRVVLFVATIEQCDNTTQKPTAKSNKQTNQHSLTKPINQSNDQKRQEQNESAYSNCYRSIQKLQVITINWLECTKSQKIHVKRIRFIFSTIVDLIAWLIERFSFFNSLETAATWSLPIDCSEWCAVIHRRMEHFGCLWLILSVN